MKDQHKQLKEEYHSLFRQIREILFDEDPIGINFAVNTDEYDPEVGTILPRLKDCSSIDDVQQVVHEEFVRWFEKDIAGSKRKYRRIAERIWTVIT